MFGDEILIYPTYKFRYTVSSLEINLLVFTKQNFFYFPEKCKSYLVQLVNQKIEAREVSEINFVIVSLDCNI